MIAPGAKSDAPLISEFDMSTLTDFVAANPGIEFISLPRVRNSSDVSSLKQRLSSIVNGSGKIKVLSKIQSR